MRIAVVVPRYGPDVLGGAETLAKGFAEEAARRGWTVEIWTTCARSHYTWKNVYPAGRQDHRGVAVRRFPITHGNAARHAELDTRLAHQTHLPVADQYAWLDSGAHSTPLYEHVALHAAGFEALIALPCAAPLVQYASWAAPERTVVWPCLHDEPYAYMEPTRLLLESAWGTMFLSPEEKELAVHHLAISPRRSGVVGGGVVPIVPSVQQPKELSGTLLYAGRLEPGKGVSLLYDYVKRYVDEGGAVRLIVLGEGPLPPPRHPAFKYRGFVSRAERTQACASALALCQPSINESFSLTIMESWLAGRPVIVHGDCIVTRGHVQRSSGGLWFRTYEEFAGAVEWLQANPAAAARMGENGRRYVLGNYTWEAVVTRFEQLIRLWERKDA
jgi:glycosyltransferase involved in cell wall biosynthesis